MDTERTVDIIQELQDVHEQICSNTHEYLHFYRTRMKQIELGKLAQSSVVNFILGVRGIEREQQELWKRKRRLLAQLNAGSSSLSRRHGIHSSPLLPDHWWTREEMKKAA